LHGGFASAFVKAVPNLSRHFWTFAESTVMFFAASFDLRPRRQEAFLPAAFIFEP
jgi:hypothetical protein